MHIFLLALLLCTSGHQLEIKDGDHIVILGSSLLEREQQYGYVELMLHAMHPDKKFTVRNLAWSGDTVWGEARAGFGTAAEGYKKLIEQVKAEKPTVLVLGYGTNEAFGGTNSIHAFRDQYWKLVGDLHTDTMRYLYLLPPHQINRLAKNNTQFKQHQRYNEDLSQYNAVIRRLMAQYPGHCIFLDQIWDTKNPRDLTDDGHLPNEAGYKELGKVFAKQMNNTELAVKDLSSWEPIRQLILQKNQLYFYKYRPANDTYLFLFRKHEQGNNAAEIPKFDPLIAELDAKINEMKGKR